MYDIYYMKVHIVSYNYGQMDSKTANAHLKLQNDQKIADVAYIIDYLNDTICKISNLLEIIHFNIY